MTRPITAADIPWGTQSASARSTDKERSSQADQVVSLAQSTGAEWWRTPAGDAYVTVPVNGHRETYRVGSSACREWLTHLSYIETGRTPRAQALSDALATLSGIARYGGTVHDIYVRVGAVGDAVYLDLGQPDWSAVEITRYGWRIVTDPPVRFRRPRGLLPLPRPEAGGSIDELRDVLSIDCDADWTLIVAWLVGALRPRGPYPVLSLSGEQGAGKSTRARLIRNLIDPSSADLRAEPREIGDLMVAASNGWIVALDNLSRLSDTLSDGLCRLATGGTLTKRQLYTDGDEFQLVAQRPVMMTAITEVATRGDLLDRCVSITLPPIDDAARRTEAELANAYEAVRPRVLGALLDAAVCALAHENETRLDRLPRMADWCRWATAAEPALGWKHGTIVAAYSGSRAIAIEAALDGDRLAMAIRAMALPWKGTATDLLQTCERHAGIERNHLPDGWPRTPRGLTAALRRLAPHLRRVGFDVALPTDARTGRERIIRINAVSAAPKQDRKDTPDERSENRAVQQDSAGPVACPVRRETERNAGELIGKSAQLSDPSDLSCSSLDQSPDGRF